MAKDSKKFVEDITSMDVDFAKWYTDIVKKANGNKKALAPYVTYLTIKSSPIFTSIVCLLLALTTMITFVFLGTFTVALDDTTTKIYNDSAFANGDPTRIVILHPDKSPITKEELKEVLDIPHVENVIEWSRVCDFNYYYKEGTGDSSDKVTEQTTECIRKSFPVLITTLRPIPKTCS